MRLTRRKPTCRWPRTRACLVRRSRPAATDGPVSGINPEYVLACKATDELSKTGTLRDETLRELLDRYGETISRKIVLMIGWFNMLSLFLNGCRVPLETTDKVGTRTSPLG